MRKQTALFTALEVRGDRDGLGVRFTPKGKITFPLRYRYRYRYRYARKLLMSLFALVHACERLPYGMRSRHWKAAYWRAFTSSARSSAKGRMSPPTLAASSAVM